MFIYGYRVKFCFKMQAAQKVKKIISTQFNTGSDNDDRLFIKYS